MNDWLKIEPLNLLTILGMAVVTYATRAAGLWLMGRITLSKRIEVWLSYVPGAVLVAIIMPAIVTGGVATLVATVATTLVAVRTRNMLLAMVIGVATTWLLRMWR